MSHHEIGDDVLITGVLVVRAWGLDRFNDTFKKAAHCVVNGEIPLLPGVLYEADPGGGGGPGTRETQRRFDFVMDGRKLPGEPEYPE